MIENKAFQLLVARHEAIDFYADRKSDPGIINQSREQLRREGPRQVKNVLFGAQLVTWACEELGITSIDEYINDFDEPQHVTEDRWDDLIKRYDRLGDLLLAAHVAEGNRMIIVSSPAKRAIQTAEIVAEHMADSGLFLSTTDGSAVHLHDSLKDDSKVFHGQLGATELVKTIITDISEVTPDQISGALFITHDPQARALGQLASGTDPGPIPYFQVRRYDLESYLGGF